MENANPKTFSLNLALKLRYPFEISLTRLQCIQNKLTLGTMALLLMMLQLGFNNIIEHPLLNQLKVLQPVLGTLILISLGFPVFTQITTNWNKNGAKIAITLAAFLAYIVAFSVGWNVSPLQGVHKLNYFLTGSFIVYVITLLNYFETRYILKTGQEIETFKAKRSPYGLKEIKGDYVEVALEDLEVRDKVKVPAGDFIPRDGIIIHGTTSVDESPLTSEFKPLLKGQGDQVVGGTINRDSDIIIELNRKYEDNILERIIKSVDENHCSKLKLYHKTQRFSLSMSFLGILATIIFFVYKVMLLKTPLFLVVSPTIALLCSFSSLSLAAAIMMASNSFLGHLLSQGILIKNSKLIEKMGHLSRVFFDKTGTLTQGRFEYAQTFIELGTNQGQFLSTIFSLESQSDHPLAKALETHPWYHEIPKHEVNNLKSSPGLGIAGKIHPRGEKSYFGAVGNLRFLKRQQMSVSRDMKSKMDELEAIGETVLVCGYDRQVKGLISFSDNLRPHVKEMLSHVKKLKIEPIVITGDSVESLASLAADVGITRIYPRSTPEEKAAKISKENNEGHITAFVGTPSDKAAFEKTHISVATDTGTDLDQNDADIMIMGSDIRLFSHLLAKAKKLLLFINFQLFVSLLFTLCFAGLSILGLASAELITSFSLIVNLYFLRSAIKNQAQFGDKQNGSDSSSYSPNNFPSNITSAAGFTN